MMRQNVRTWSWDRIIMTWIKAKREVRKYCLQIEDNWSSWLGGGLPVYKKHVYRIHILKSLVEPRLIKELIRYQNNLRYSLVNYQSCWRFFGKVGPGSCEPGKKVYTGTWRSWKTLGGGSHGIGIICWGGKQMKIGDKRKISPGLLKLTSFLENLSFLAGLYVVMIQILLQIYHKYIVVERVHH